MTERELIQACKQDQPSAQKALYERYSPVMFGVCRRYLQRHEDAEDILVEAFYKIFNHIGQYNFQGSFEGWMRRIVVNEALMFLRKKHALKKAQEIQEYYDLKTNENIVADLAAQDILGLLDQLPDGYRTIFNLYVLEGYKHREIAEKLGISINTSKSQLILAKKRMRLLLEQIAYPDENFRQ